MTDTEAPPPYPKKGDPDFKEKRLAYYRIYRERPEVKAKRRAWHERPGNKAKRRARVLWRKYGLSPEVEAAMLTAQNGLCFTCGKPPSGKKSHACLSVDHCHKTGKVGKMLCAKCNPVLGLVYDDPALLRNMADYLERYR